VTVNGRAGFFNLSAVMPAKAGIQYAVSMR